MYSPLGQGNITNTYQKLTEIGKHARW